jgi:hypothetical protein
MSVIEIDWQPDKRTLRQFGIILAVGLVSGGCFAAWKLGVFAGKGWPAAPLILWAAAAGVGLAASCAPGILKPVYLAWMGLALPLGWVVSHLALGAIYLLLFTPLALFFRLIGRDAMHRKFDPTADTYWVKRDPASPATRYFRQF